MISKEVLSLIDMKVGRLERQAQAFLDDRDNFERKLRRLSDKMDIIRRAAVN